MESGAGRAEDHDESDDELTRAHAKALDPGDVEVVLARKSVGHAREDGELIPMDLS